MGGLRWILGDAQLLLKHWTRWEQVKLFLGATGPGWLAAISSHALVLFAERDAFVHFLISFMCLLRRVAATAAALLTSGVAVGLCLDKHLVCAWQQGACLCSDPVLGAEQRRSSLSGCLRCFPEIHFCQREWMR
jgi:hypothetical protein